MEKSTNKIPEMTIMQLPGLIEAAAQLPKKGRLALSPNQLLYLDIDDEYIHRLFPLLKDKNIQKPNYFGPHSAGAHISVIYPEENFSVNFLDASQEHWFSLNKLVAARIAKKTYYMLLVHSLSLIAVRNKHHLPDLLCFKGYDIGLHITIGVSFNDK